VKRFKFRGLSGYRLFGAILLVALISAGAGQAIADAKDTDTYKELALFGEVFEKVRDTYVEPVSDEKLIEYAINGMLTSLDPHSSYMNEKNFADMQVQTKGTFGGLGLEVTQENGLVKVVSPIDDTPASRADIKPGDFIVGIDGEPVMGMPLADAVDKMRGEIDTTVKLTIRRGDDGQPFDVTLKREEIKVKSVKWDVKDRIGYIRIGSFNEQTQPGLDAALKDIQHRIGSNIQGYVLDLRNNPGGLLDQAISVSSTFLDGGEVVSTRGRKPDDVQRYDAKSEGDETHGAPLVVLINGGSASASEIVAGALQDHSRAVIMGTQSFGKGSVQTIMQLQGHGAIRLTTARYYTPSGRSIQGKGITPDIVVYPAKVEEETQSPYRREADLKGALKNTGPEGAGETTTTTTTTTTTVKTPAGPDAPPPDAKAPYAKTPDAGGKVAPTAAPQTIAGNAKPGEVPDYQLERALDLLRGMSVFNKAEKADKADPAGKPVLQK
jgi:carboxyl-terminal processing protease